MTECKSKFIDEMAVVQWSSRIKNKNNLFLKFFYTMAVVFSLHGKFFITFLIGNLTSFLFIISNFKGQGKYFN
jgi:hypothetical protein